ncbi:VENN motif pre-toxin domain-containing protein [Achromobacter ruhlandii]|uniref:VENN motif pre-toxin domain-containing protein n=1 Tax=Achromobacter ruhlandii TaxID=72557 RepID=UPI003B9A578F
MIARQLFPGKAPDALSETENQQVSALSQLAAGIAGGPCHGGCGRRGDWRAGGQECGRE